MDFMTHMDPNRHHTPIVAAMLLLRGSQLQHVFSPAEKSGSGCIVDAGLRSGCGASEPVIAACSGFMLVSKLAQLVETS